MSATNTTEVKWTVSCRDDEPNRLTHARHVLLYQRVAGVVVGG